MAARLRALWDHPAGLKTVFFWAPTMKWGLVFASIADMRKPADTLSVPQTTALATTGLIWSKFLFCAPKSTANNANCFTKPDTAFLLFPSTIILHSSTFLLPLRICINCQEWRHINGAKKMKRKYWRLKTRRRVLSSYLVGFIWGFLLCD